MKKLMIAAAIVCAAAFAQAATVSWQVKLTTPPAVKVLDQTGNAWTLATGPNTAQTAYLMLAADTSTFVDNLKAGTLSASDYLDSTTTFTAATGVMSAAKETANNAKITKEAQAFNVVLVYKDGDGKDWYQISSTTVSSKARESEGDPASLMFNTGDTFADSKNGWLAVSSGPDPVPEPTSGLLLLLGMAGLALRRRRA